MKKVGDQNKDEKEKKGLLHKEKNK